MCHHLHLLIVVLKKTVTVHPTLRLCVQKVLVVYGVWQKKVFASGKLYFTCDVPEANCLPQGLEPPAKPAAKPAPKAAKPRAKPSKRAAKPAAQVAAKPAANPAAGEPIPVAPVEHVQLFKVKRSRQKKLHTKPVAQ